MRKLSFLAVSAIVVMGITFTSCSSKKALSSKTDNPVETVSLKAEVDSVSYIIGASYGQGLREQLKQFPGSPKVPANVDALISGFVNAAKGDSIHLGMDMEAAGTFVNEYFQNVQMREIEAAKEEEANFLAENKTKNDVITTESGLQYKVITEGAGPKPAETDVVKVHYRGTLLDGEEFDSTAKHGGEPAEFLLESVIEGWTEGVQLMPVGSKYIFWIPSALAYDKAGPSHQLYGKLLIFEVELLEIVDN